MELVITKVILDLAVRPVSTFAPSVTTGNLQKTTDFRTLCLMISDLRQGFFFFLNSFLVILMSSQAWETFPGQLQSAGKVAEVR